MKRKPLIINALVLMFALTISGQYSFADHHGGQKHEMKGKHSMGKKQVDQSLVILSSDSLQTQGMAMVLSNTMAKMGTQVSVLLCDAAGDLALKNSQSDLMKPKNVSPKMLLKKLQGQGAKISVCALYLPNSDYKAADLLEGVGVAKPDEIAALMTNRRVRVFSF